MSASIKDGLDPYSLGFGTRPYQDQRRVGPLGRIPGFESAVTRFIDHKISVILFINTEPDSGQMDLANRIASFYFKSN